MHWIITNYIKTITAVIFIIGLIIIFFHFYILSNAFYFTGDITSYFEPAFPGRRGDLLSVFIWSYAVWPPLVSFILNILRFLPISIISQHHLYIFIITLLSAAVVFLVSQVITSKLKWQIPIVALLLFTSFQALLFMTAMSEPLFILTWLAATFCLERFMATQKERFLLLYIASGSLIPLSRYSGIPVLLGFELILFSFVLLTLKTRMYSLALTFTSAILVWIPILIYLLRNYLLSHTFFGTFDILTDPMMKNYLYALMSFLPKIGLELLLPILAGLIIGTQLIWNNTVKNLLIISAATASAYYLGLASSMTKIRFTEYFPSRYTSVAYPELLLASVCLGAFLMKFRLIANFRHLATTFLLITAFIFGYELFISSQRFISQTNSSKSVIYGAEYSAHIRDFCRQKNQKFIFLRESSRNWIGQALSYYCQPITPIPLNSVNFDLPSGALVYTPYQLKVPSLKLIKLYQGDKKINLYQSNQNTILPVAAYLRELKKLETQE